MARCSLCCRDGGRRSRPLCKHVTAKTTKQSRKTCYCSGVTWGGLGKVTADGRPAKPAGHRWGSSCGRFGVCEHHPSHSEKMYALLETPVRIIR